MRQISKRQKAQSRKDLLKGIERHLERTAWAKGGQIMAASRYRVVAVWPGARPGAIKAGARKLYDRIAAEVRREQKGGTQ